MTNTMKLEDGIVTSEFLRLFRKAESITVKIDQAKRSARLYLTKKIEDKDFGQAVEVRIDVGFFYGYISCFGEEKYFEALFHTFGLQYDGNFQALLAILKPGDELRFDAFDSKNGYMEHAQIPKESWPKESKAHHTDYYGLHGDTLRASIYRKSKEIVKSMTLISTVTPKNSCRSLK